MRLTLDANILVRANGRASGPARRLLDLVRSDSRHTLVLSRYILAEVRRTLHYHRLQAAFKLTELEIQEHVALLQQVATIIEPVIAEAIVRNDPEDDPVLYTAIQGRVDVLCSRDRDFFAPDVIVFCRERGVEIMDDVTLLRRLATAS